MDTDPTAPLASLSLTHVYYDPNDPVSYLCAWLALVPQALCVVYATLVWSTREAEVALMFAGQLACEAANFVLKRLIREERPGRIHGKGYGMPSSHAQFAAFWAVALTLFLVARHQPSSSSSSSSAATTRTTTAEKKKTASSVIYPHRPWSLLDRVLVGTFALGLAAAVAWSRVYLGYHTPRQVVAGSLAGAVCAVAWFAATAILRRTGWLALLLEAPPVRWLRVRDLVVEEDLAQAGWEKWEARRTAAAAAKNR